MKYYAYCVLKSWDGTTPSGMGIDGQTIQTLVVEDVVVIVSQFDGDIVPITRANVLLHESVVRSALVQTTPLPFRFGTLVTDAGLRSFIHTRHKNLLSRLAAVQNCVEMSVKIIWQQLSEDSVEPATSSEDVGAGTAFLRSKHQELLGNSVLNQQANEIGSWLKSSLTGLVRQEFVQVEPRHKIVVAAAFLIEKAREYDFKHSVRELQKNRPELHFLTSGPWPPYTFANIDLEFETHFGVS